MNVFITRRTGKKPSAIAWVSFEKLINLATAAQIPVCGGAFGIAKELISMFNDVSDSQTMCRGLLKLTARYSETIWEFVNALSAEYVKESQERQAVLARQAIRDFGSELEKVKRIVEIQQRKRLLSRFLFNAELRAEIDECKEQLVIAHQRFKDAVSNIVVANTHETNAAVQAQGSTCRKDRFKILGARALDCDEIEITGNIENSWVPGSFWTSMVKIKVKERDYVAKIYTDAEDGEEGFLRDIKSLSGLQRYYLPRLYGHCQDSATPFIVLNAANLTPLSEYLNSFSRRVDEDASSVGAWKMLINMREVGQFFCENRMYFSRQDARILFEDAKVDEKGDIVVAPLKRKVLTDGGNALDTLTSCLLGTRITWQQLSATLQGFEHFFNTVNSDFLGAIFNPLSELEDIPSASTKLREHSKPQWQGIPIPGWQHMLKWGRGNLGDVGILQEDSGEFEQLGHIGLGSMTVTCLGADMPEPLSWEKMGDMIRITIPPETAVSDKEQVNGDGSNEDEDTILYVSWHSDLEEDSIVPGFPIFAAKGFADEHKMELCNLIMVTGVDGGFYLNYQALRKDLATRGFAERDLYLFVHMNNRSNPWCWSWEGLPSDAAASAKYRREMRRLGCPDLDILRTKMRLHHMSFVQWKLLDQIPGSCNYKGPYPSDWDSDSDWGGYDPEDLITGRWRDRGMRQDEYE
ncbi:hypothetical protein FRB99_005561 [Tulasnella sp. 403]|nr:hypothetical protein FRB99_005561 [Tulasnella sp. 403]